VPNILRNSIINAAELVTFDQAKEVILKHRLMQDNIYCHFVCSAIAGLMAATVGSPVDVVKTRIMNANKATGQVYSNIFDCIYKTFRNEGFFAFYKGFTANAGRIVTWNIVMFVTLQQIRRIIWERFYQEKH